MKRQDAFVGKKVKYPGNKTIGACTGKITKIFKPDPDDYPFYQDGFAAVEVDELPQNWPYTSNDFAPPINELSDNEN